MCFAAYNVAKCMRQSEIQRYNSIAIKIFYKTSHLLQAENKENFTRQGSLRRVLPSGHNKDNVFGRQHEDLNKSYKKFYQEYAILAE